MLIKSNERNIKRTLHFQNDIVISWYYNTLGLNADFENVPDFCFIQFSFCYGLFITSLIRPVNKYSERGDPGD